MSKYSIEGSTLSAISDAVREKDGTTEGIKVSNLASRILAIPAGSGGADLPEEAFVLTKDCSYKFANSGWDWFVNLYGNKITSYDITNLANFAYGAGGMTKMPFDLNIKNNCTNISYVFNGCNKLTSVPRIVGTLKTPTGNYSGPITLAYLFSSCSKVREIPYDYFHSFGGDEFWEASKQYQGSRQNMFNYCYSLRELPDISILKTASDYYDCLYNSMCGNCYALNGIYNLPVLPKAFTSNAFLNTFMYCYRLKTVTFEINEDGSPIVVNWKNQVIDLSQYVGYARNARHITQYNSGLTTATQITDDATYQALKDNPDSWCAGYGYSRYNHDSAVETINSLPDVSGSGGTNTIKFKGISGELTDGGAINTLTEEEIAVAAVKGWTVALV